jgi:3-oxoacyl-[acyl-carrier-protein] synthase-3
MLYLHGLGHFHPENVISNQFLEELDIGTNEEWIIERVGILSRRTVLPLDYIRSTRNQDQRAAFEAAEYNNAQTGSFAAEWPLSGQAFPLKTSAWSFREVPPRTC